MEMRPYQKRRLMRRMLEWGVPLAMGALLVATILMSCWLENASAYGRDDYTAQERQLYCDNMNRGNMDIVHRAIGDDKRILIIYCIRNIVFDAILTTAAETSALMFSIGFDVIYIIRGTDEKRVRWDLQKGAAQGWK